MSVGGGAAPSVLETLEFPAVLERVASHAVSALGAARVRSRTPRTDAEMVRAALAQVTELASRILADEAIRAEPVPDLSAVLDLLTVPGSTLEGPALVDVARTLGAARTVAAELDRLAPYAPRTAALRGPVPPRDLETSLGQALDPDGSVRDAASRDLARARRAVRETRERLIAKLGAMLSSLDARERSPDAAVTLRAGRYVIPVRNTARGHVGGIVHDESATGTTLFVEPAEAIDLGNELRAAEVQEQREVLRVLRDLTERVRPQRERLAAAVEMCVAFDDLCARARYAIEVNGFAPAIREGPLTLWRARHPLLLGGETVVVPFDLVLADDERTLLISGPNTGGKTVLIKAVGLICLLAQSGVVPPLGPDSAMPIVRDVFADIGDRQSIAESLSTFSAHVAALRDILARAGAGSLVLLDEVGSGTDPAEGAALASAVLRTLTRRRAVTLATTHLGALKQLATETVGIVNASLQFDAETLTPTYRLLKGVPGRSYGLAIARRLGVAAEVLHEAEQALPETERALDALLAAVEERTHDLDARDATQRAATEELRVAAERVAEREMALDAKDREIARQARELEHAARAQARAYLLEARRRVEEALALARAAVDEATAKEARRLVEQAIETTETRATPVARSDKWLSLDDLRRQRQAPPAPRAPDRRIEPVSTETVANEVSLRGLRIDEAEARLIRALDDAVLADLPSLRVIHGKGTGAVRRLVHEMVAHDPRVKSFALAPANQGGTGVTIVEFRK